MNIYDVFVNGKVVQTFEADDFFSKADEFVFSDAKNNFVGSIVKSPGMSVKKVERSGYIKREERTPSRPPSAKVGAWS